MLPYFFVCNHTNYARYAPLYFLQLLNDLPDSVKEEFKAGHFTVKLSPHAFCGLWSDMGVEMSVIKDTEGSSGIIGFTCKGDAVPRWSLSRNILAEYAKSMAQQFSSEDSEKSSKFLHEQQQPSKLPQDVKNVLLLFEYMIHNMSDPFDLSNFNQNLLNFATGVVSDKDVETELLNAIQTEKTMLKDLVLKRFEAQNEVKTSFYKAVKKSKLKTFTEMEKKRTIKRADGSSSKEHVSPEYVYRRALILSNDFFRWPDKFGAITKI